MTLAAGGGINQEMGNGLSEIIRNKLNKSGALLVLGCAAGSDLSKMEKLANKIGHTVIANTGWLLPTGGLKNEGKWREVYFDKDGKLQSKLHHLPNQDNDYSGAGGDF